MLLKVLPNNLNKQEHDNQMDLMMENEIFFNLVF
jgi:hypothetical protein